MEANVDRILQLFADHSTKARSLHWAGSPSDIRTSSDASLRDGHELASHGVAHIRADHQSRAQFATDVRSAKEMLEDIGGTPVLGYRADILFHHAPNLWALKRA